MSSVDPKITNALITAPLRTIAVPARAVQEKPTAKVQESLRFALTATRRWWKVVMPLGVVLSVLGAGLVYWQFTPEYQASSWLKVHSQAPFIAFQNTVSDQRLAGGLKDLMRSRLFLASLVSDPEVARLPELQEGLDPINQLAERLDISAVGGSEYFAVHFRCGNAQSAAAVANKLAEAYVRLQNSDEESRKTEVLRVLDVERVAHAEEVSQLRNTVEELTRKQTGRPMTQRSKIKDDADDAALAALQHRLVLTNVDSAILRAEIESLQKQPEEQVSQVSDADVDQYMLNHPDAKQLEAEQSQLELMVREYERTAGPKLDLSQNLGYQRTKEQLERRAEELTELRQRLRSELENKAKANVGVQRHAMLQAKQAQLQKQEIEQKVLQDEFRNELAKVKEFTGSTLELEFKRAELDQATQVLNLVSQRILQLKTELQAPDRALMVEEAKAPAILIESLPLKKMLMAAMALLIAPFGLAVAWEWWMDRVTEPRQMESQSPLRVVGEVVTLPRVRGPRRTPALRPRDTGRLLYEESVDSLRTCMSLSSLACDARVVAFTSAVSREGKTSLAVQFALSAARASRERVLIIDGDMRCPDIHKAFDVPLSWGLVDVLNNSITLAEAIRVSQIELIDVLPAGKLAQSPHQLMGGDAFHRLVEEAKSMYRYVVIDTPPVLAAGEALVLAKEADAALVCARRDFSRLSQVRAAHQRLLDAGAQPIGAVLNGVSASSYRFRYGTYDYAK